MQGRRRGVLRVAGGMRTIPGIEQGICAKEMKFNFLRNPFLIAG
jgi:hypothetical protein